MSPCVAAPNSWTSLKDNQVNFPVRVHVYLFRPTTLGIFAVCGLGYFLHHCCLFCFEFYRTSLLCLALLVFLAFFLLCFVLFYIFCFTIRIFRLLLSPRVCCGRGSFFDDFLDFFSFFHFLPFSFSWTPRSGCWGQTGNCPPLRCSSTTLAPSRFPAKEHRHPHTTVTGITPIPPLRSTHSLPPSPPPSTLPQSLP